MLDIWPLCLLQATAAHAALMLACWWQTLLINRCATQRVLWLRTANRRLAYPAVLSVRVSESSAPAGQERAGSRLEASAQGPRQRRLLPGRSSQISSYQRCSHHCCHSLAAADLYEEAPATMGCNQGTMCSAACPGHSVEFHCTRTPAIAPSVPFRGIFAGPLACAASG